MSLLQRTGEVGAPAVGEGAHSRVGVERLGASYTWRWGAAALLILALAYAMLQNGRWVSGTDTGYYLAVAKNLVRGEGFAFNGGPVRLIPPLWPLVLAGAMKVSTSFWFLNLLPMAGMLVAAGCWYGVLLRLTTARRAAVVVVVSGLLFYSYMSAVQLRTEALFCATFAGSMLLAMQVVEGRGGWWRVAMLCVLVALMVLTRWAGVTAWAVVAGVLVSGKWVTEMELDRPVATALLTLAVALGTFGITRLILKNLPSPREGMALPEIDPLDRKVGRVDREDMDALGTGDAPMSSVMSGKGVTELARSFVNSGKWVSSVLWMPAYFGVTNKTAGYLTNAVGWVLIALFLFTAWRDGWTLRRWLWIGVVLYCASLVFRMRVPNPRYFAPVAPLIVVGVWLGLEHLAQRWQGKGWATAARVAAPVFLVSVLLVNGALWGVDAWIFRSADFYSAYRGGNMDRLLSASRYLGSRGVTHGEVAVSPYYHNLGRPRPRRNGEGLRTTAMLTGVGIRSVPEKLAGEPDQELVEWMKKKDVRYYLYRPPESPWRAHHFRIASVQSRSTNVPVEQIPVNPSWDLYELREGKIERVVLEDPGAWPTHVPGL